MFVGTAVLPCAGPTPQAQDFWSSAPLPPFSPPCPAFFPALPRPAPFCQPPQPPLPVPYKTGHPSRPQQLHCACGGVRRSKGHSCAQAGPAQGAAGGTGASQHRQQQQAQSGPGLLCYRQPLWPGSHPDTGVCVCVRVRGGGEKGCFRLLVSGFRVMLWGWGLGWGLA